MSKCIELYFIYIFVFASTSLHYNCLIISRNSSSRRTSEKFFIRSTKMSSTERILTSFLKETFTLNVKRDKFKLRKFIVFKNEEKKLNKWKMNMLLHFYCFSQLFSNEKRKVLYALFYTEESASTWTQHRVSNFLQNIVNKRKNETNQIFHDFKNLTTVLKEAFKIKNSKQAAEIKIQRLKQTESAEKYAVDFRTLIYQLSWTNESMLSSLYYTELKDKVKDIMSQ